MKKIVGLRKMIITMRLTVVSSSKQLFDIVEMRLYDSTRVKWILSSTTSSQRRKSFFKTIQVSVLPSTKE
jgi:hypothetical protein